MSRIKSIFLTWPLFVFLLLDAPCLYAGSGLYGAKAAAMGTAFVAVSDDPSAMAFNPAGLVALDGNHVYGGGTVILPYTSFRGMGY